MKTSWQEKQEEETCDLCGKKLKNIYALETPRHNDLWMCGKCAIDVRFKLTKKWKL